MEKAYTLELDLHEICLNNCDISVFLYYHKTRIISEW